MEQVKYYFIIKRNNVTLFEGKVLWEEAWNFAINNCPCSVNYGE